MSFANLKRSSNSGFEDLQKKLSKTKSGGFDKESTSKFWRLSWDKETKTGYAVIRFLPECEGESEAFVRLYKHSFQDPNTGKWYIENSRTTIGEKDPVSEANSKLWNTGIPENQEIVRKRKRQQKFISNIYVVSDPKNPENEGKVFLFEYGPKIFAMLEAAANPQFVDDRKINPFDLWNGANFKLKAHEVSKQRSYDKSSFEEPAPLSDDDSELERIWKSQHSLAALVAPEAFKPYDVLKKRFEYVIGHSSDVGSAVDRAVSASNEGDAPWDEETSENKAFFAKSAPKPTQLVDDDTDLQDYASLLGDE